jgi:ADP-ribose pyrophosphatase
METWIQTEQKYTGSILSFRVGTVRLEDGSLAKREVVDHPGGAAVVPFDGYSVFLVRQFRVSIGKEVIELPAGRLHEQEDPQTCAARELEEELGYRAKRLKLVATYYSSVGFTNEKMHIFLGFGLKQIGRRLEADEHISMVRMPIRAIQESLSKNAFEDAKTLIGLHSLMFYLKKHPVDVKG